jgi:hypothetical protein
LGHCRPDAVVWIVLENHLDSPAEKHPGVRDGYTWASRYDWRVSPSLGVIYVFESVCDAVSSSLPFSYALEVEQKVKSFEGSVRVSRVMSAEASSERRASQAPAPIESTTAAP